MMSKFKQWLLKPYPFPSHYKPKILITFGSGFFVSFFLFIFKPFDFYLLTSTEAFFYSFIYGLITISIIFIFYFLLPKILPSFFDAYKWNIGKMILIIIGIVSSIGVINWLISDFSSFNNSKSNYTLVFFLFTAILVGIFPFLIYIYYSEKFIDNKNKSIANNLTGLQPKAFVEIHKNEITLIGDNKNEEIQLNFDKLLFINSEKNYVSVYHFTKGKLKETVLRSSLNKIEKQLSDYSHIIRCHKSYIVNTNKVLKIQGNARGYFLIMENSTIQIPVSRSFPKELLFTLINT